MPGYQRFVTYMFRYKDEKKQENCGFAKIEIRQGHCRVQIQITGMKGSEAEVYFLSKDAYVPVGIYLGKLRIQEGICLLYTSDRGRIYFHAEYQFLADADRGCFCFYHFESNRFCGWPKWKILYQAAGFSG